MAAEHALHLYDSDTGEVVPIDGTADQEILERLNQREQDYVNLQREFTKALRKIKKLESDKERQREESAERQEVEEVFAEWQEIAGKHRSKLGPARHDAIAALLRLGYTRDQFSKAIRGGCYDPFTTTAKNGRLTVHNDIELICRDEKHFEAAALKCPKE